jgi:hypothetical protein
MPGTQRRHRAGTARHVRDGRVSCPARGWSELEWCLTCPLYGGFADGPVERLVCAWTPDRGQIISSSVTGS